MKRVVFLFLSVLVLLAAVACFRVEETEKSSTHVSQTESAAAEETLSPEMAKASEVLAKFEKEMAYIPAEEWMGLETVAYHENGLNMEAQYAVLMHPTGSPDPEPAEGETVAKYDVSQLIFQTQKQTYSLRDGLVISYLLCPEQSKYETVSYYPTVNVERWNGNGWDRLILPIAMKQPARAMPYVERGRSATLEWNIEQTVTKPTPGRYRLVGYVDYVPVYAEFELTE